MNLRDLVGRMAIRTDKVREVMPLRAGAKQIPEAHGIR